MSRRYRCSGARNGEETHKASDKEGSSLHKGKVIWFGNAGTSVW